ERDGYGIVDTRYETGRHHGNGKAQPRTPRVSSERSPQISQVQLRLDFDFVLGWVRRLDIRVARGREDEKEERDKRHDPATNAHGNESILLCGKLQRFYTFTFFRMTRQQMQL